MITTGIWGRERASYHCSFFPPSIRKFFSQEIFHGLYTIQRSVYVSLSTLKTQAKQKTTPSTFFFLLTFLRSSLTPPPPLRFPPSKSSSHPIVPLPLRLCCFSHFFPPFHHRRENFPLLLRTFLLIPTRPLRPPRRRRAHATHRLRRGGEFRRLRAQRGGGFADFSRVGGMLGCDFRRRDVGCQSVGFGDCGRGCDVSV